MIDVTQSDFVKNLQLNLSEKQVKIKKDYDEICKEEEECSGSKRESEEEERTQKFCKM